MVINFEKMNDLAKTPTRGSKCAAGYDLYAATSYDIIIPPHETIKIGTGLKIALPCGTFGAIYPRSGLATKQNLIIRNTVGIIDEDYRGELIVAVYNDSDTFQTIPAGSRIAQLIVTPYITADFVEVDELSETERGEGGFGSTGLFNVN